jgi:hypothetical protein
MRTDRFERGDRRVNHPLEIYIRVGAHINANDTLFLLIKDK